MKKAVFQVVGRVAVLGRDDIDTDAIFPAQYLKTTERVGMRAHLFADWVAAGNPEASFVKQTRPVRILVAPRNFGCGSSREHAVWALADHGIQAVVAMSFGDIFRNNCVKNDFVAATVSSEDYARMLLTLQSSSREPVLGLDVANTMLSLPDGNSLRFMLAAGHAEQLMSIEDDIARTLRLDANLLAHEAWVARTSPWLSAMA